MKHLTEEYEQILHTQMGLIVEKSKSCSAGELVDLTRSLTDIFFFLYGECKETGVAGFRQQENES